ncbi:MAG: hypothetical protein ABL994_06295 [Verrucomicrobiales bacterium]
MKTLFLNLVLLLSMTELLPAAGDDEIEAVDKASLAKVVRERMGTPSSPKLVALGEINKDGKYVLVPEGNTLSARFDTDLFVIIKDLDGLLSKLADPETEYIKNWRLAVDGGGNELLEKAKGDVIELQKKSDQLIETKLAKAADAAALKVLEDEEATLARKLEEAKKKVDDLTLKIETAKARLMEGLQPLTLNFRLRLGGETFEKLGPVEVAENIDRGESLFLLRFNLREINKDKEAWLNLLKGSPLTNVFGDLTLVYLAEGGSKSYFGGESGYSLAIPLFRWEFWTSMAIIAACLGLFITRVGSTDILRDTGITLTNREDTDDYWHQHDHPLSMARLQMAIWFFIIIGSFVFLWTTTGSLAGINNTALILMGISGGTSMFAAIVYDKKSWDASKRIPASESKSAVTNWFVDILSSDEGMTIHRFQIFAWTLVLSVVFVSGVISQYAMPEFSNELLGLMGISSGVYLGFKVKEG